jgi:hypothetical protein
MKRSASVPLTVLAPLAGPERRANRRVSRGRSMSSRET